jgi:hypothetical protein
MRCEECELYINNCLGICDARCLVKDDSIDFFQLKTLIIDSQYKKANLPLVNIFLQRKAAQMIKSMFNDVNMLLFCVAVYKNKISEKNLAIARTKTNRVEEALASVDIIEFIKSI